MTWPEDPLPVHDEDISVEVERLRGFLARTTITESERAEARAMLNLRLEMLRFSADPQDN